MNQNIKYRQHKLVGREVFRFQKIYAKYFNVEN